MDGGREGEREDLGGEGKQTKSQRGEERRGWELRFVPFHAL